MSRYGYPPSHRDHRQPQPEVCELCGLVVEAAQLRTVDIEGLRGRRICAQHEPWRNVLTHRDIERLHPGLPSGKFVGQARVYEPGDAFWHLTDPMASIKSALGDGDCLLVADDLATGFSTWTDRKSGVVWTVESSSLTVATDTQLGGLKAVTMTGVDGDSLVSSGLSYTTTDGMTVILVVKVASAVGTNNLFAQQFGSGTARIWLRAESDSVYRSKLGNGNVPGGIVTALDYTVLGLRGDTSGNLQLRQNGVVTGTGKVTLEVSTGQLILCGNTTQVGTTLNGKIAAAVVALSDLGAQTTAEIEGALTTYYNLHNPTD